MINLFFYNSYQNSPMGFQFSEYTVGTSKLNTDIRKDVGPSCAKELLSRSGCKCVIGRSDDAGVNYFVFRGLNISGPDTEIWYVNFGIEADEGSKEQFCNIVTGILFDFNSFEKSYRDWFKSTPENSFSYTLNFEKIDGYIYGVKDITAEPSAFYSSDNPHVSKLKNLTADLSKGSMDGILLLVPETTESYFNKQNPSFEDVEKHYVFNAAVFKALLRQNKAFLDLHKNTDVRDTVSQEIKTGEFAKENKHTIELACKIAIGALTVAGAGALIKKYFFRR